MTTSKPSTSTPVEDLLPHRGPLRLVDSLIGYDADCVKVALTVRDAAPFGDGAGGVPAYLGLEYMAQAIQVFSGLELHAAGEPPKIGLLIGTRRYRCSVPRFIDGAVLLVSATRVMGGDEALWVFDCQIADQHGTPLASAQVKAYRPTDIREFLDVH